MTLALLLTAVTGAWAQSTFGVKEITADMLPASWSTDNSAVTADDLAKLGFMEVTKDAAKTWTGAPQEGVVRLVYTLCESVNWVKGEGGYESTYSSRKIFYSCLDGQRIFITTELTEWELKPDETGKNWTLDKMPANDIELQVEYFNTVILTLGANANEKGTVEVINELTVNDGTITNNVVPAYTYWFDEMTKSQHVIPAAKLSTLNGCKIKSLKYYVSENRSWTSDKDIDVYVKEVDYTTMTAMEDKANCTTVYTGKLTVANGEAIITFATPYTYNGGNLLVGIENLEEGDCNIFNFLGVKAEGASMGGHDGSYEDQNFLPKVTFAFDNPNIKDNGDGTYEVEPGAQIAVKATPAEGYYLKNWSNDETNNEAIRTITMESDTTLTAIFDNCAVLTIAANDASRGVAYVVNAQEKLIDTYDTEHTIGTVTDFNCFNDVVDGYWVNNNNDYYNDIRVHCKNDNSNVSHVVFYGPGDNSYEASVSGYDVRVYLKNGNTYKDWDCTELLWTGGVRKLDVYATEYALPEGVSETTTPGSYYVVPGSKVPVEAAPFVQYSFSGWSNSETKAAFELTVNETTSLTASFVANPVLTIAPSSAEMGTVSIQTVEGEGLIAEVVAANVEGDVKVEGIYINAPYIGAEQTEWTSNDEYPYHFVIEGQKVSSVVFYGRNGRYVSKGDNNMYTSRTMEAQAAPRKMSAMGGSVFLKDGNTYRDLNCTQLLWKGGVTRIEIYGNGTVLPDGVVAINAEAGSYTVAPGTEVTVTATPAEKCHLQSWSDGAELNEQNTNTFTMTAENKNLVASFMPNTYQLVIDAGEFATFYEDWNVKFDEDTPEGVNFYTIASVSGETAVLSTALEGVVAGQTPLLVYNGTETVLLVTIVPTTETAEATPSFAEQFRGTATDREFTAADMEAADFYALSGGKIFVQVEDEGTLAANQCWLQFNHELMSGARSINLVFDDETTGLKSLTPTLSEGEGAWYDLNGRKLQGKPTKKGVYMNNGRKVVVK